MRLINETKPKKKHGRTLLLALLLPVLAGLGWLVLRDTTPPALTIKPDQGFLGRSSSITVTAQDEGAGLKRLVVQIKQGDKVKISVEKAFSSATRHHAETISLEGQPLDEGSIEVIARADDAGFFLFAHSQETTANLTLDSKPPRISPVSVQHNLTQGGSGLTAFEVNEDLRACGIAVGERFFPAYRQENGRYLCLFAMPWDTAPASFNPVIQASDLAGNKAERQLGHFAKAKTFRHDRLNLPESFLVSKGELFQRVFPNDPETDPLGRYIKINNVLRKQNRAKLLEIGLDTSTTPLWNGEFLRSPGRSTALFADNRDYYYNGVAVDNQTHLGVDLAHQQNSPIAASNNGRVVYADFLGIYGECVILDHGIGLQTIYSHLSRIDVKVGDTLTKGQILGLSGMTGLAGGDHLHFGVLVSGVPVQPQEWWDRSWITNNITLRFD